MRLRRLVDALVPTLLDGSEIRLVDASGLDHVATAPRDAPDLTLRVADLEEVRARVLASARREVWRADQDGATSCVVACVLDGDDAIGTITCVVTTPGRVLDADAADAVADVGRLVGTSVGRELLQRRARDAARRSQRLASQLHQLIAASIAVAGIQRERDVVAAIAPRARSVFDADEAVVTLDRGPGAPLQVAARRGDGSRLSDPEGADVALPSSAGVSTVALRDGDWLVAPLLEQRGATRGSICVRRSPEVTFSDDDVEVASLLAQTASSALDATEMHQTIQRSEERLRVLVDTAPIGIVETDLDGGIEWWNRAAADLFGWPAADLRVEHGDAASPAFPDAARVPLRALWAAAASGETVSAHDLSGVELGGRRRELAASVALVSPAHGRRGSLLTVVEDVTDHRQLMEELRHAQRMDVIGQLSSSVAHDFNNLLTLIAGYAELLKLEAGDDGRAAQLARDIQTTTTRASTLTGKLLTMGRTKLPAPAVFSPVASVRELSEVLDRILGAEVALTLSLDATTPAIRADVDQFEQMVMNLATNARDAMDDGGELRIAIGPTTLAAGALEPGDYVRIEIADTGAGMDEETLRRCFEPLFTTKGPSKGTGLGLPAARRVVVESGGSIEVHSERGVGTTFEILFPAAGEVPADAAPTAAPAAPVGAATILLAEDEAGIRELLARILRHNGFEVLETESGEQALDVARAFEGSIDLLVSDVVMLGMSGGELAATLQAERPDVLVVLVSGNVDSAVVESVAEGTGVFLAKPFKPSELIGVIAELLGRHRATTTS
ncbi:MAG TPA: ATP-binding protein [Acidimicrobiales bacterium]|nr:ATP-binding protein [Acidimicrobiales bacterium]